MLCRIINILSTSGKLGMKNLLHIAGGDKFSCNGDIVYKSLMQFKIYEAALFNRSNLE